MMKENKEKTNYFMKEFGSRFDFRQNSKEESTRRTAVLSRDEIDDLEDDKARQERQQPQRRSVGCTGDINLEQERVGLSTMEDRMSEGVPEHRAATPCMRYEPLPRHS